MNPWTALVIGFVVGLSLGWIFGQKEFVYWLVRSPFYRRPSQEELENYSKRRSYK